ncbi:MAG: pyruvate synthase [Candidatus Jettenia sp.]|nr:pyruvate synthase [Candidatus Jettenia sp. AMX1]MBC6929456.1 pyruvate synthase [Candidatus Jettenia sp.]NUN22876.1 pyruvate synthase [Candidatus Jettenia caeni]KAA0249539.1 MAG: pyruvate synthase [Candidatus Jettenia sp. AMX1]MCE7880857.1 pyruvate synthase [Candidatus Jettenia sp. AMX1]MCQ3927641.1 pyruvate synthase [Candidatus Jettenia sp.]
MIKEMLTGNAAVAWGVRLAEVDYIPAYPITPQTEIIETLARWISNGDMDARFVTLDSEHSMITAAGAASATGVRVFTATSSQGLLYGFEMLYTVAGWRVPLVMVNVSRALSSPITLEPDHNDILAARDAGFLQIHCETCQEVLDSVLIAYRLAEDERVLLPVLVNMDGFHLSFTREPVEAPDREQVVRFLPPYQPKHAFFKASQPMAQGTAVIGGSGYSYFKYQMHLASMGALDVYREVSEEFGRLFGRSYNTTEGYMTDDAEYILIMTNSFSTLGKAAVKRAREKGVKAGLLRLRLLRPFPELCIKGAIRKAKAVAIVDQNISVGKGGILYSEISSVMYNEKERPLLLSFIGGLGGKTLSSEEFEFIFDRMIEAVGTGAGKVPYLLYTEMEWKEMKKLKNVAGKGTENDNNYHGETRNT